MKGQGAGVSVPVWTSAGDALVALGVDADAAPACRANNELVSLARPLDVDTELEPLESGSHQARSVYRQTLSFVLAAAADELKREGNFPASPLCIGHSLGYSFYYYFAHDGEMNAAVLDALDKRMRAIVAEDRPIAFRYLSWQEADAWFRKQGMEDTAGLLSQRDKWRIPVYSCGNYIDLQHCALLSRTGLLKVFALETYQDGFILRFPDGANPGQVGPCANQHKLFGVFSEYKKWGRIEEVHTAAALNERIRTGRVKDFIRIAEAFHAKKLSEIAEQIYSRRDDVRVVLIAGPSSSGKTTSAKRLSIELQVVGLTPHPLSLDNYYNHPDMAPKDENGKPDLEALEALNIDLLNEQLLDLLDGKEVVTPLYNFFTGQRESGPKLKLGRRDILVVEGIHGLNDALTPHIPAEKKFKLYVSALTQLNIDAKNRVATSDNRLLRRIVRDYNYRGASAQKSIAMWLSVRRGEEKNIFPFQDSADAIFNSALDYELAVLKFYADPILRAVPPDSDEYAEAVRLLSFLANFEGVAPDGIPPLSILREFIGGSDFHY
jgi:uridine kinase